MFVRHGDPLPLQWMAEHPGWVKFPATLVPRPGPGARRGRATPASVEAAESSGLGRPVSMGAPMVERPGMRNRGRPPRFPGRFGGEEGKPLREDPIAAYRRVSESLAAMGLMEPVAAWHGKHPHGTHKAEKTVPPPPAPPPDVNADLSLSAEGHAFIFREETQGHLDETRHLYWPGSQSGVTLGAGYDFKYRLRADHRRPDPAWGRSGHGKEAVRCRCKQERKRSASQAWPFRTGCGKICD